ncbi:hypothetical protein GGTG_08903 [Gaeumannomyces tritici R3-111a-1]|uniref:Uncharacterized protein n=1 Tax=Gaeumannomyces tritici (strain R3-111a-1) TaxID=644352 RepID=J3P5W3_GAET3|nr:hypothetical protein GGTG_08903 [Gaeumannomyces tritici R3-111a-1]EJT75065.1 hypothetical protein GGTG_08903 [Gaeumannomyces tritici R3-111a-1]
MAGIGYPVPQAPMTDQHTRLMEDTLRHSFRKDTAASDGRVMRGGYKDLPNAASEVV